MHCTSSPPKVFKYCCVVFAGVLAIELLLLNILFVYGLNILRNNVPTFDVNKPFLEQLFENPTVRDAIHRGKSGGFVSLLEETLERVYVTFPDKTESSQVKLGHLGLDVSHSGEAIYIYNRIMTRSKDSYPYKNLVVDIGANDGLLSSNSFNFIRWGWDAVLVEPQSTQLKFAKRNLRRYFKRYSNNNQTIKFVEAVIGQTDGMVQFVQSNDVVSMESHVLDKIRKPPRKKEKISSVKSLTVRTFVDRYNVTKYFGVLSIDAEGQGYVILRQFIELGIRPAYIIYEDLHEGHWQSPVKTIRFLESHGYQYLHKLGWNHILEYHLNR